MNKKAVLFTITTFMMLFSLFLLSGAYANLNKQLQKTILNAKIGTHIKYVEDDISSQIFFDLLGIRLDSITNTGDNTTINFTGGIIDLNITHAMLALDYKNFIERNYSSLNNLQVNMSNFTSKISITPYNASYYINNTRAVFKAGNLLKRINLQIILNNTVQNSTNSSPADNGGIIVYVDIIDKQQTHLIEDSFAILDPTTVGNAFSVALPGASINVQFGFLDNKEGTMIIEADNLTASMNFEIIYSPVNETISINGGNLEIIESFAGYTKQTQIKLIE